MLHIYKNVLPSIHTYTLYLVFPMSNSLNMLLHYIHNRIYLLMLTVISEPAMEMASSSSSVAGALMRQARFSLMSFLPRLAACVTQEGTSGSLSMTWQPCQLGLGRNCMWQLQTRDYNHQAA